MSNWIIFCIRPLNWEFLLKWYNFFWNRDFLLCITISIDFNRQISFPLCWVGHFNSDSATLLERQLLMRSSFCNIFFNWESSRGPHAARMFCRPALHCRCSPVHFHDFPAFCLQVYGSSDNNPSALVTRIIAKTCAYRSRLGRGTMLNVTEQRKRKSRGKSVVKRTSLKELSWRFTSGVIIIWEILRWFVLQFL